MENFDSKEYRDGLAEKLKDIRNSSIGDSKTAKAKAQGYLDAKQETKEYKWASLHHLQPEKAEILIKGKFLGTIENDPEIRNFKEMKQALLNDGVKLSAFNEKILETMPFSEEKNTYNLVSFSVNDFGLHDHPSLEQIYQKAEELGLKLCPGELAPLFYIKAISKVDKSLYFATKDILDGAFFIITYEEYDAGYPSRDGNEKRLCKRSLFLAAGGSEPDYNDTFVFVCPQDLVSNE